ncbi:MAG: serine/threonine protein kinase, partial [Gemmataceae bacterium]|nr:serine/threonine protein kinase [Gemmataceae bacterium]
MPASETATGGGESNRRLFGLIRRLWGSTAPQPAGDGPTASAGRTGDYPPFPVFPAVRGYVLVDELGRGGMGVVYRALDLGTGRTVALKAVYPVGAGAAAVRARFEREVRALARIKHPNIVPVYHAGEGPGFPFFTMEYVPGGTLQKHLDRVRADLGGAVRLVAKVARAVERLHAAGVWHRDLKPLNILLGDGDEPLVADFGLAKFRGDESDMTQSGAVLGTRHYMSPEQTRGQTHSYSPACDIWAVGVILYELLTGRRPFAAADPVELYRLIREEAPESCSATNPGVPPALDAIARRCMAKRPEDRYRTAAEVAAALERWLADGTG